MRDWRTRSNSDLGGPELSFISCKNPTWVTEYCGHDGAPESHIKIAKTCVFSIMLPCKQCSWLKPLAKSIGPVDLRSSTHLGCATAETLVDEIEENVHFLGEIATAV